jgi:hypothetical protein
MCRVEGSVGDSWRAKFGPTRRIFEVGFQKFELGVPFKFLDNFVGRKKR